MGEENSVLADVHLDPIGLKHLDSQNSVHALLLEALANFRVPFRGACPLNFEESSGGCLQNGPSYLLPLLPVSPGRVRRGSRIWIYGEGRVVGVRAVHFRH